MKGTIQRDESGAWWFQFSIVEAGRRRHVKRRGFARKKDAEAALATALAAHGAGDRRATKLVAPSTQPLREWLETWLAASESSLKPSTMAGYRNVVRAWIAPAIGDVALRDITPDTLTAMYAQLAQRGGRGGRPLSPRSVQLAHVLVTSALTHAVETGALAVNPARQIARKGRPMAAQRAEMTVWSPEEATRFLAATSGSRWHALWAAALDTGARRGELAALRWADVDLEAGTVAIRRNRVVVAGSDIREGTPKGKRGREVHLAPGTVAVLRRWKAMQTAERLEWGPAASGDYSYLFTLPDGTPPNPDRLSWELEVALRTAGVPRLRFHDLRHTSATLDLRTGIHPKVVQERLGHSSISMTLDVYTAFVPSMGEEAAARRDAVLYGP